MKKINKKNEAITTGAVNFDYSKVTIGAVRTGIVKTGSVCVNYN